MNRTAATFAVAVALFAPPLGAQDYAEISLPDPQREEQALT